MIWYRTGRRGRGIWIWILALGQRTYPRTRERCRCWCFARWWLARSESSPQLSQREGEWMQWSGRRSSADCKWRPFGRRPWRIRCRASRRPPVERLRAVRRSIGTRWTHYSWGICNEREGARERPSDCSSRTRSASHKCSRLTLQWKRAQKALDWRPQRSPERPNAPRTEDPRWVLASRCSGRCLRGCGRLPQYRYVQ